MTNSIQGGCCRMCRGEDIVDGGCISPRFCPCHPKPQDIQPEWESNDTVRDFVYWYFGRQEYWSTHEHLQAKLMGERLLSLLQDHKQKILDGLPPGEERPKRLNTFKEGHKSGWNDAISYARKVVEDTL